MQIDARKVKILSIAISIFILVLLVLFANPEKFAALVAGSDKSMVIAALGVSTFAIILRILKWRVLVGVPFRKLVPVQLVGVTASNFSPGKIAEPVKSLILKIREGLPVSSTLPSVVWER
ncbi:flippase-like domain-containing protein, partial [Candidatus Woesearchaeota archaeon]|nr:flippase-like domain-containing protein [Candidatus Woesearchaeota archaeon]